MLLLLILIEKLLSSCTSDRHCLKFNMCHIQLRESWMGRIYRVWWKLTDWSKYYESCQSKEKNSRNFVFMNFLYLSIFCLNTKRSGLIEEMEQSFSKFFPTVTIQSSLQNYIVIRMWIIEDVISLESMSGYSLLDAKMSTQMVKKLSNF